MTRWTQEEYDAHQAKIHKGQQPEQEGFAIDSMQPQQQKKRKQPESIMQILLFDNIYAHEPGGELGFTQYPLLARVFHPPTEGYSGTKGIIKGQKRHREGVRAGIFDIFCDVPRWTNISGWKYPACPGLRIELKAPGGKMSDAQTDWLNYYREAGYKAEICFGWEESWNIICDYLGYEEIKA